MSHIQTLNKVKLQCDTTGECGQYQTLLRYETAKIDAHTANAIQGTVIWGVIIAIIGLVWLLTPFIKPLQKLHAFLLPKLATAMPILLGLAVGALAGFAISFSACFKQDCSSAENLAIFIIPLLSLVITIPLARVIYRRNQSMSTGIARVRAQTWMIWGGLFIGLAIMLTVSGVTRDKHNGEHFKQELVAPHSSDE